VPRKGEWLSVQTGMVVTAGCRAPVHAVGMVARCCTRQWTVLPEDRPRWEKGDWEDIGNGLETACHGHGSIDQSIPDALLTASGIFPLLSDDIYMLSGVPRRESHWPMKVVITHRALL
jgi:hypothetical protein